MITSNKDKSKAVDPAKSIADSIRGVLDDKKMAAINKAIEKVGVSQDLQELVTELKELKAVIENNSSREWKVEIQRDSKGFISSLRYYADK